MLNRYQEDLLRTIWLLAEANAEVESLYASFKLISAARYIMRTRTQTSHHDGVVYCDQMDRG